MKKYYYGHYLGNIYNIYNLFITVNLFAMIISSLLLTGCTGSSTGSLSSNDIATASKLLTLTPLTKTVTLGEALSFEAAGGTEPYSFDVYYGNGSITSVGATGNYQAPIAEGTAVIRVQDAVGNAGYATVEITDAPVIEPTSKTLAVTNKFPFAVLSGKTPYTFSIVSGEGTINATTGLFTAGNNPGAVVVRVTDADGRSADANVTINAALSFTVKNIYVEKTSTYTLAATGGIAPYSYFIVSGSGSVDKTTGVYTAPSALGTATIHIVDTLGNFDFAIVNITTTLGINPTSALIAKNSNLLFSAIGGAPPFSYSIQVGGVGSINAFTGEYTAPAVTGSATIRVTDSLGHTSDANVTVTNSISFSVANLLLAVGNTYDFANTINGGVAPLTYTVPSSQGLFTGSVYTAPNTPGVYTVTVSDSQAPTPNSVTTVVAVNSALILLPSTSSIAADSQKSFSASGGVPPYTYSIQSGGGSLNAGLYTAPSVSGSAVILVTDARGNTATASITIQDALVIIPTTKTLSSGESFTFTASGGNTPYSYSLVSGSGAINSSTGLYTAPSSAGLATVRVEDAAGNKKDALISILNPLSISPPSISLIKNGAITFTASGGAGPYSFSMSSGDGSVNATTGVFTASATPGTSTVRVMDSLGSIKDATVTIYDGLSISPFTKSLTINQTFTFTANGGIIPYTFSLVSGAGSISKTGSYSSNTVGTALVRVTDSAGNTSDATISVSAALAINPTTKTLAVNNNFTFSATGGIPPYAFSITSGNGTITSAGNYKAPTTSTSTIVRVTDSAGATADAVVTVNDALTISPVNTTIAAGGTQSFITAGGAGPYVYAVISGGGSFSSSTYTAASIASGANVSIVVTDTLGNTATATININPITVTISSPNSSDLITTNNKAAFAVSGTCSESGRAVNINATGGISATANCASGTWSTTLNLTAVNDGAVTITATHTNVNLVAATPATVTLTKDGSNPTVTITTPTNGSYVNDTPTVVGTCTKQGPINITITGGITANTTCENNSYSKILNLASISDGTITISVAHTDNSGNAATPVSVNVTKDSIAPSISAFAVTNTNPSSTAIFNLTFTSTGTASHYCILENSIATANCNWTSLPLPTSFTVSSIQNDKVLSAWVKDLAGNISLRVDSNSVTLNTVIPNAPSALSLSSPSTSPNNVTTPIIQVAGVSVGDTVSIYTTSTCNIGSLKGSATVSVGTSVNVTSSILTDNTYTFYAKTVNTANTSSSCSTASVSYTLDTLAPTTGSISINNGATYTKLSTVPLTLTATGISQMYITNTAGCASGGTYETYATTKTNWTLSATNATNTVYAKFKDAAGNETPCVSDTIIHDNTAPNAPTSLSLGSVPIGDSVTPTLSWTAATDNSGGSGIATYQVQIYNVTTGSINTWTTSSSGGAITVSNGLLVGNATYYMKVRAVDNAGNLGTASTSSPNWTAIGITVPDAPTIGTATAGNAQATITFTPPSSDGGSAITSYTVASNPDGISATGSSSPITVTGLNNGTAYIFTVVATNTVGNSAASAASNSITPVMITYATWNPLDKGSAIILTGGNLTADASNHGWASVRSSLSKSSGKWYWEVTCYSAPTGYIMIGIANNSVLAERIGLDSATSYGYYGFNGALMYNNSGFAYSTAYTNEVIGVALDASTGYTTFYKNNVSQGQATKAVVGPYYADISLYSTDVCTANFGATAFAYNPPSGYNAGLYVVDGTPSAPTIGTATAGGGKATITFTAPSTVIGDPPITSYTVTSNPGGLTTSGTASPLTLTGLTQGVSYTFNVVATNFIGNGTASAASNSVIPTEPIYAKWNSADKGSTITLSNGSLTSTSSSTWSSVRSTISKSSGKWYWEITCSSASVNSVMIGIANSSMPNSNYIGATGGAIGFAYYNNGYMSYSGSTASNYGTAYSTEVIGVALDASTGYVSFYKNNINQGLVSNAVTGPYYPAISHYSGSTCTANFGATAFTYAPPAGYTAGLY